MNYKKVIAYTVYISVCTHIWKANTITVASMPIFVIWNCSLDNAFDTSHQWYTLNKQFTFLALNVLFLWSTPPPRISVFIFKQMPVCHTHLGHVACFFDSTINSVSDGQTKSIPKVIQGESESKESNKKDSLVCVTPCFDSSLRSFIIRQHN